MKARHILPVEDDPGDARPTRFAFEDSVTPDSPERVRVRTLARSVVALRTRGPALPIR